MRAFRWVVDILFFSLFVALLLWCAFLLWGAFSQHRICILLNARVLEEIRTDIASQAKGVPAPRKAVTDAQIKRLQDAQKDLFNANSLSFHLQFAVLILITIGVTCTFRGQNYVN